MISRAIVVLLFALAWLSSARPATAQWSLVASSAATHVAQVISTTGVDTTGATLIVVGLTAYSNVDSAVNITDSKSNSWTPLTTKVSVSETAVVRRWWTAPTSVGSAHTFTFTGTYNYGQLFMMAFSGAHASPFDQESGLGSTGAATSGQPGSLTPTTANSLCVSFVMIMSTNTPSGIGINGSYTLEDANVSADNLGGASAYKTCTSAENPTWNWTGSNENAIGLATFTPAAVAGGPPGRGMLLGVGP